MVHGKGVNDAPFPVSVKGKHIKEYRLWKGMLGRCYSVKPIHKHKNYVGTEVDARFLSFMNFYEWCHKQVGFEQEGWQLEKDILGNGESYSPDTTVFVPQEINNFFVKNVSCLYNLPLGVKYDKRSGRYNAAMKEGGKTVHLGSFGLPEMAHKAYCLAKARYAKQLAEKWEGLIDARVYNYLVTYKTGEFT